MVIKTKNPQRYTSNSLAEIIKQASDATRQEIITMYDHYYDEYTKLVKENPSHEISVVASFHELIEGEMQNTLNIMKTPISCFKGCSHCCHQLVDVSNHEARLLATFVRHNDIAIDKERLQRQSKVENDKEYSAMPKEDRRCVFLDEEDGCVAYEYRPSACRKLYVTSPASDCDIDANNSGNVVRVASGTVEVISTVMINVSDCDSLAKTLLPLL